MRIRGSRLAALALSALLVSAAAAQAIVPNQVDFQGLLLDASGQPASGAVTLTFALFDAPTGGASLWSETHPGVQVVDGVYDVTLGAQVPLTPSLLATANLHLEVEVEGETLSPRRPLLAVPYAVRSETAESAETIGGVSSTFVTQLYQSFAFDGSDPPNDDPSEGFGDSDADGLPNFIDPDNDDDGLLDGAELAQGSDINLVTPAITQISPASFDQGTATLAVEGSNFAPGMAASFDGAPVTPVNVTATSFDVTVTQLSVGATALQVTLANGESASGTVQTTLLIPTITQISPSMFGVGTQLLTVSGSGFAPGMTVTFGGAPVTPVNISASSFEVTVTATGIAVVTLEVTIFNGQTASDTVSVEDRKQVFTTATATDGNLGGMAGADASCQARAAELGLGGTFFAWLGDSTTGPAVRFNRGGPYVRHPGGQLIAPDFDGLTDGSLDAPIGGSGPVWTNVAVDGDATGFDDHCQDWTSGAASDTGRRGEASSTGATWTTLIPQACDQTAILYCFEQ